MSDNQKPNVLFICVDQWGGNLTRPVGHKFIKTPTIAQLAQNGVTFNKAYASTPTCIPARRAIMTGLTAKSHGDRTFDEHQEMPDVPTLADCFKGAGYQTFAVGKLHVYPQRDRIGFDEVILNEEGRHHLGHGADDWELFMAEKGYAGQEFASGMCTNDYMHYPWSFPDYCHQTNWTAREMCKAIRRRDPRKPALWYMSFNCPHPPVDPLQAYLDQYRDEEIEDPAIGEWAEDFENLPYALKLNYDRFAMKTAGKEEIRMARKAFFAQITHVDHQIRVVIGYLREEKLLDNTIIVFTSDHGDMLGNHNLWAKTVLYEESNRIPLFIVPAEGTSHFKNDTIDERLVEHRDIMPTLLDMAGIDIPKHVEGMSLIKDESRDYLYGEHNEDEKANRMIRDKDYKLIYYPTGNKVQLFNITEDPQERYDLSEKPNHKEKREELEKLLIENMYGSDMEWVKDGKLTGLPDIEYQTQINRGLTGQRGYRFL
ncbi:MAG: sulfatase-like hydrolase/transferase [Planctomycetota bacterium]|jgi:arylsulfatase A-like enzyme